MTTIKQILKEAVDVARQTYAEAVCPIGDEDLSESECNGMATPPWDALMPTEEDLDEGDEFVGGV
ncbi:hypothetical protein KUA24_62 [Vibrio phage HNL01]|nr:hypothetical protein KUA24_62 [Vibrio phage HNL01]